MGKKPPKAKQDEAIIGTNDYSIVSKRSVEKLYYQHEPEFLRAFVHKYKRRAPLINRGYWLRMRAIESVVKLFLNEDTEKSKAVVNLGCGYEPLAFRMLWKYPKQCSNVLFVDVDFPQLIQKKVEMIRTESLLSERLGSEQDGISTHPSITYQSKQYCAVGCDLGDCRLLEDVLRNQLHLDRRSILFISEVAIVYMPPEEATTVISMSSSFPDARFCLLEQCLPAGRHHPFASRMDKHFKGTPLRGLRKFPTIESQCTRFEKLGWGYAQATDLWSLWQNDGFITDTERAALDCIEPFDEWEGLALWAGHNLLLLAATAIAHQPSRGWRDSLVQRVARNIAINDSSAKATIVAPVGHRDMGRINGAVFPAGPRTFCYFGGTPRDDRQGAIEVYTCNETYQDLSSKVPVDLSFATVSSLGDDGLLLVGGRASPLKPSSACFSRRNGIWCEEPDLYPARYRHCAAPVMILGSPGVLVFGGKTGEGVVLQTWALFANGIWQNVEVHGDRPPALFGSTMAATGPGDGVLIGGMDQYGRMLQNSTYANVWRWSINYRESAPPFVTVTRMKHSISQMGASRSLSRFGAAAADTPDGVLVIGGVGPQGPLQCYEEAVLVKKNGLVLPCRHLLDVVSVLPMFIGHSVISSTEDEVLVFGGGTVCFSYGSYWNGIMIPIRLKGASCDVTRTWRLLNGEPGNSANRTREYYGSESEANYKSSLAPQKQTQELQGEQVARIDPLTLAHMPLARTHSTPCVLSGLDLGSCASLWTPEYLIQKVGPDKPTIIHSGLSPHLNFRTKNFAYTTVPFAEFVDAASTGSHVYMRALSASQPSKKQTSLHSDYPDLSQDFQIPDALSFAGERQHSSVLRISGNVNMWLHYDVMSNILCQITGSKRVLLFPPSDVSKLNIPPGETTSNLDVFSMEREIFKDCSPVETILKPGEILFIPACWPHATAPATEAVGMSVAVNIFFKSLDDDCYAAGRDVYGNRDIDMYQNGRKHIAQIKKILQNADPKQRVEIIQRSLEKLRSRTWTLDNTPGALEIFRILAKGKDLPDDLAGFYLSRLADEIEALGSS